MANFQPLPAALQQWVNEQTRCLQDTQACSHSTESEFDDDDTPPVMREEDPNLSAKLDQLFPLPTVTDWGLSSLASAWLESRPEVINWLTQERAKPPFPAEYTPSSIALLYNDVLAIRSEAGRITYYARRIPANIMRVEFYFDDELAASLIDGGMVVNRISEMANLDAQLGRLPGGSNGFD